MGKQSKQTQGPRDEPANIMPQRDPVGRQSRRGSGRLTTTDIALDDVMGVGPQPDARKDSGDKG
jgi:hypothetical protein